MDRSTRFQFVRDEDVEKSRFEDQSRYWIPVETFLDILLLSAKHCLGVITWLPCLAGKKKQIFSRMIYNLRNLLNCTSNSIIRFSIPVHVFYFIYLLWYPGCCSSITEVYAMYTIQMLSEFAAQIYLKNNNQIPDQCCLFSSYSYPCICWL